MKINELNVKEELKSALTKLGFEDFTPVQEKALPILLEGKDAEVEAPTGTGKTLCYGLPFLNSFNPALSYVQGLVLCPTRELAIQVEKEINKFASDIPAFKAVTVYGGQKEYYQLRELKKNPSVVVATPGRLLDFLKRGKVDVSKVSYLVLDECDEMLDMGFIKDIDSIISYIKAPHQTSLYSATISEPIRRVSKKYLKEGFSSVKVVRDEAHLHQIDQKYVLIPEAQKKEGLVNLINDLSFNKAFVFARTKHKVKVLQAILEEGTNHSITSLQGNLSQNKRDKAMDDFKQYKADIMVATDIAARGIDVSDVDLVINFDAPEQDEFYLHRIGRTGRVEAKGTSYTFLTKAQLPLLKRYESLSKAPIEKYEIPKDGKKAMNKYLLSVEKNLSDNHDKETQDIKEACERWSESEGRTILPIEVAAMLLQKLEEATSSDSLHSEKHFESIEKNRERKQESFSKPGLTRYFINIGSRDGFDENGIVDYLLKQSDKIEKGDFGDVYMKEAFSFFSIRSEKEADIEEAMSGKDLKGRALRLDKSGNRDGEGHSRAPRKSSYGGGSSYHSHNSSYHDHGSYHGHSSSSYGDHGSSYHSHSSSSGDHKSSYGHSSSNSDRKSSYGYSSYHKKGSYHK